MIDSLVIDRAKWNGAYQSRFVSSMLQSNGKMCCLGILGRACGVPDDEMLQKGFPSALEMSEHSLMFPRAFVDEDCRNTQLAYTAAQINDYDMPVADKEVKLVALFKEAGIALTFEGSID